MGCDQALVGLLSMWRASRCSLCVCFNDKVAEAGRTAGTPCTKRIGPCSPHVCKLLRTSHCMQLDALLLELFAFCEAAPIKDPRWLRLKSCALPEATATQAAPPARAIPACTSATAPAQTVQSVQTTDPMGAGGVECPVAWHVHLSAQKQVRRPGRYLSSPVPTAASGSPRSASGHCGTHAWWQTHQHWLRRIDAPPWQPAHHTDLVSCRSRRAFLGRRSTWCHDGHTG